MRALSVKQPFAELIATGKKKKEFRSWSRSCFGDLLIVASKTLHESADEHDYDPAALVFGRAVCIVDFHKVTGDDGDYAWHFRNPRRVAAVPIKGSASLYHVEDARISFVDRAAAAPSRSHVTEPSVRATGRPPSEAKATRAAPMASRVRPTSKVTTKGRLAANLAVVVDADPSRRTAFAVALEAEGFEVQPCSNGADAWAFIRERRATLVVSQPLLGDMSGLDLLYRCRGTRELDGMRFYLAGDRALLRGVECDGVLTCASDIVAVVGGTSRRREAAQQAPPCPKCKAASGALEIVYGEPGPGLFEQASRGEIVLGGCCIDDDSAAWKCAKCGTAFGRMEAIERRTAGARRRAHR